MSTATQQANLDARLKLVEEHLRAENEHDVSGIMATFGSNAKFGLNGLTLDSAAAIRDLYEGFGFGGNGGFSQIRAEVVQRHLGAESIVMELLLSGKHTAEWQGIPATNKEFSVPACAIFTFDADEKLAAETVYFDATIMLRQFGVIA